VNTGITGLYATPAILLKHCTLPTWYNYVVYNSHRKLQSFSYATLTNWYMLWRLKFLLWGRNSVFKYL